MVVTFIILAAYRIWKAIWKTLHRLAQWIRRGILQRKPAPLLPKKSVKYVALFRIVRHGKLTEFFVAPDPANKKGRNKAPF